ncbi:hypothetical protein Q4F19_12605 [Sphingomonas sp. BIUV-7]|uniref:DUF4440 domain-containing protein n=1 Tax=Sphingomonas natans TaxID=3063330 RepID=A0ABT8YA81_9SPHN|nr:hypothetical protein [Sphingomonas sp. BIUV-7]MDO6415225.1 hypothetical protein [Sphingomonas sp. BIUV-7]
MKTELLALHVARNPAFAADLGTFLMVEAATAVVTGVDHIGGTAFGHYGEMYLRFTDVLVRRDGRWQLVVQQATSTSGF